MTAMTTRSVPSAKRLARQVLGDHRVRKLKASRTRAASSLGLRSFSRPGLSGLDVRVADRLRWRRDGTFLEVGANDGMQQSNTYLLERELGWTGFLVEADHELARECARNRPDCTVICAALGDHSDAGQVVSLRSGDLRSNIVQAGRRGSAVTTLDHIADSYKLDGRLDLLVVDVEGYELNVIRGLNLNERCPDWLLVETSDLQSVDSALASHMHLESRLSHHDYLFARNDHSVPPPSHDWEEEQ